MIEKMGEPSRRQAIAGVAMFSAFVAMHPQKLRAEDAEVARTAESIHQEVLYRASRKRVFNALMETSQFDRIIRIGTGGDLSALGSQPTAISRDEGGSFTIFGGHILGRQIELVPDERIVQAWRVADWKPGIYSIARFELAEHSSGTRVIFDHTGFPAGLGQHLADGWKSHYWDPLKQYLDGESK